MTLRWKRRGVTNENVCLLQSKQLDPLLQKLHGPRFKRELKEKLPARKHQNTGKNCLKLREQIKPPTGPLNAPLSPLQTDASLRHQGKACQAAEVLSTKAARGHFPSVNAFFIPSTETSESGLSGLLLSLVPTMGRGGFAVFHPILQFSDSPTPSSESFIAPLVHILFCGKESRQK